MPGQSSGTSQQSITPSPWLGQQLQYAGNQAVNQYNSSAPQYYPGSTVASQSPATNAYYQDSAALAQNGNPAVNAGQGFLTNAASGGLNGQNWAIPGLASIGAGDQLNTNPGNSTYQSLAGTNPNAGPSTGYLQSVMNGNYLNAGNPYQTALNKSISDAVLPQVEGQFSAAGRYGSPSMGGTLTTALADAIAPAEYANYQAERGQQTAAANQLSANRFGNLGMQATGAAGLSNNANQAAYRQLGALGQLGGLWQNDVNNMYNASALAPTYNATDLSNINNLGQAGAAQGQYGQNLVNADINQWNYNQNLQQNKLAQLFGLLSSGSFGQNSTTTQTQPGGGALGALGGLLGAAPALLGSGGLPALFA